jgi:hypothetical protein
VAFDSEGGAASANEGKGDGWHEATVTAAAPAEVAGAEVLKTMGAEETDTEVPISEMAPRPDPGRQYVGWAGGVLQCEVCDDGGGSRATTTEAGGGIDDACTSLGDADIDGSSLAAEAGFGAEVAGSDFRPRRKSR